MAKRIFDSAQAVPVELVSYWALDFGASCHSLLEHDIHILDVEMDADRRSSQALGALRVHLGKFVGQHDYGITDLELGMANSAVGLRYSHPFDRRKSLFVKFDGVRRPFRTQMWCHRMIAVWNWLYCHLVDPPLHYLESGSVVN